MTRRKRAERSRRALIDALRYMGLPDPDRPTYYPMDPRCSRRCAVRWLPGPDEHGHLQRVGAGPVMTAPIDTGDIVGRLRDRRAATIAERKLLDAAADEIERLQRELDKSDRTLQNLVLGRGIRPS